MRLLLDTHAFLWFVLNDPQLSVTAQQLISDPANDVLISPATYWKIAIIVEGVFRRWLNDPGNGADAGTLQPAVARLASLARDAVAS